MVFTTHLGLVLQRAKQSFCSPYCRKPARKLPVLQRAGFFAWARLSGHLVEAPRYRSTQLNCWSDHLLVRSIVGIGPAIAAVRNTTVIRDHGRASLAALTTRGAACTAGLGPTCATAARSCFRSSTSAAASAATTTSTTCAEDDVVIATRNVEGAAERCHDEHHRTKGRTLSHKYLSLLSAHAAERSTKFTARKTCFRTSVTQTIGTETRNTSSSARAVHASLVLVSSHAGSCSSSVHHQLELINWSS